MKLYLQILIIGILLISSNCQTCIVGGSGTTMNGFYDAPEGASNRACTSNAGNGACQATFSDRAGMTARTPPEADCDFCATSGQYLNSVAKATGVACSATTCATGYTDMTSGEAASATLTRNCDTCVSTTHTMNNGLCYANCATNGQYFTQNDATCGTSCIAGYTDSSTGGIASTPLAGNCVNCLSGLVRNTNGVCECQTSTLYLTSPTSGSCGAACATGFTDSSSGGTATTSGGGLCLWCLTGTTYHRGSCQTTCATGQFFTQNDGTCGTSCAAGYTDKADGTAASTTLAAHCQYCLSGYTDSNSGCASSSSSSSQILKASFFILLLIALIF